MLEGILYFALGFLSAAMIALMVSPAIWGRAVALTRKRVENSVPLTLNEIQADKDQLRAEFAMSTRRLEMSVEELREKAASQVIEISRKRDELARIAEESRERIKAIEELEVHSAELRARLKDREEKLSETNARLEETSSKLSDKAKQLENLRNELSQSRSEADSSRIELVAKQTEMQNLSDRVSDIAAQEEELKEEIQTLRTTARQAEKERGREERKRRELERKIESLQKQLETSEENLASRERELARLRENSTRDETASADLNSQLVEARARNVELEAKLAQSALQMEALLNDASNDNVEKAMASLARDKEELQARLDRITTERDSLKEDLTGHTRKNSAEWEVERRENAILRERINDLAAQVTAMTAAIEGDSSTINEILAETRDHAAILQESGGGKAKRRETAVHAGQPKTTLADRIRALQDSARNGRAS